MTKFFQRLSRKSSAQSQAQEGPPSFFNDDPSEASSPSLFWSKDQITIDSQGPDTSSSFSFYKQSKKKPKEFKTIYLTLYKNYLIASKTKEWKNGPYKSLDLANYFVAVKRLATPLPKYVATFTLSYNLKQLTLSSKMAGELEGFIEKARKYFIQFDFEEKYDIHKKLGSGSYASVYRITDKILHEEYAAKFFEIAAFKDYNRSKTAIKNEVKIHRQLEHGKICKFYETYESATHLILVMEYAKGERLINYVIDNAPLPEKQAKVLFKDLLESVAYLHSLGIIHRDIKLENVMINPAQSESEKSVIKLIDFGLSATVDNIELFKRSGTPGYVAPEVLLEDTYGTQADVFSLGVILFTMVSGRSPFVGSDRAVVLRLNKRCEFNFKPKYWDNKTADCINLVKKMMEAKPTDRLTVQQSLNHRWFSLLNAHVSQSLKVLNPKGIGGSLTPSSGARDRPPPSFNVLPEKSKTGLRDNSFASRNNRPTNLFVKSNSHANRSYSPNNGELPSPGQDLLRSPTPNLLQIPQNGKSNLFPSSESVEHGETSAILDGMNKASLRTFYKLGSDLTEEGKSEGMNTPKRSVVIPLNVLEQVTVPGESSDIKMRISSYKELDKGLKSPFRLNSHSIEPSFAEDNQDDSDKVPSYDLISDTLEEAKAAKPKPPNSFKASMSLVKKSGVPLRQSKGK